MQHDNYEKINGNMRRRASGIAGEQAIAQSSEISMMTSQGLTLRLGFLKLISHIGIHTK